MALSYEPGDSPAGSTETTSLAGVVNVPVGCTRSQAAFAVTPKEVRAFAVTCSSCEAAGAPCRGNWKIKTVGSTLSLRAVRVKVTGILTSSPDTSDVIVIDPV